MANHLPLIVSIVFISFFELVVSNPVEFFQESFPREEWIKGLQEKLKQKLNLTEDDSRTGTMPRVSDSLIRLMANNKEEEDQPEKRIMVRPINNIFTCFVSEENNCSRFEFEVTSEHWESMESLEVYFLKMQNTGLLDVTVHFHGTPNVYHYDENDLDADTEYDWTNFHILKPAMVHGESTVYFTIETRGPKVHQDDDIPFLVVPSGSLSTRQRRSQPPASNCDCCVVDRNVTARELKMDRDILVPADFNIRACSGTCAVAQSSFGNDYGGVMYSMTKHNETLADATLDEFWMPKCYPTRMRSMTILYADKKVNQIVQVSMADMIVEACGCVPYRCYDHV